MLSQNFSKVGCGSVNKDRKSCSVYTKDFITYLYPIYLAVVDRVVLLYQQSHEIFFFNQYGIMIGFATIDPILLFILQTGLDQLDASR